MTLRESFNAAIRSDRPESPTDIAFLYLAFILGQLWIYTTVTKSDISGLLVMVGFVGSLKLIKVGSDYQKKRKAVQDGSQGSTAASGTDNAGTQDGTPGVQG